jgi:hypothetical protein
MKLTAVIRFYLPYVLPRSSDWDRRSIAFKMKTVVAKVKPRGLGEDLFVDDVDKTLSTMTVGLARIAAPQSSVTLRIRDFCFDRIDIFVEGTIETAGDAEESRFLEAAVQAANSFLCRVITSSLFITGVEEHYRVEDCRRYFLTPRTITWFDSATGDRFPFYKGGVNSCAMSGAIRSPERGSVTMADLAKSIQRSMEPDIRYSLLVDAEERMVTLRTREAVVALATACEIASNQYLQRTGRSEEDSVEQILRQRMSFAEKRLHRLPLHLTGISLRNVDTPTYDLVEKLYRARNSVAHRGIAEFEEDNSTVPVDLPLATRFLAAARTTIRWLDNLEQRPNQAIQRTADRPDA